MEYEVQYNEKKPLTHYIKNFLVGFLLVAILILLLVSIFPTNSSIQKLLNNQNNDKETNEYSNYFQENINLIKDVATSYFTLERLPQKEGDKVKLTLEQMLNKKLVVNVSDNKGKSCDLNKTYVEVTKKKNEYEMKINLSCGKDENYVIVYLGCYDYCLNYVCEKKETTTTTKKPTTTATTTSTKKYYCKVVNGKYYDNKGKVVTKTAYNKACTTTPTQTKKYKYLYEKKVEATYSEWSDWSKDKTYDPNNNNIKWGKQELVWNEKYGYANVTTKKYVADTTKPLFVKGELKETGRTYKQWTCEGYYYYRNETTGKSYKYTNWVYQGKVTLGYLPTNTDSVKYEYVGLDFDACASNCTLKPVYIFKKYTRTVTASSTNKATLSAECNELVEKNIPIYYQYEKFVGYDVKSVSETKRVYYYHTKTRTLKTKAQTLKVWSTSSNDKKLINQGYKYTGTKQEIK